MEFPCLLGKTGRTHLKREGDSKSPIGKWKLETLNHRPDKMGRPFSKLQTRALKKSDGWCDAKNHGQYNRAVKLPFKPSHEDMWRGDEAYDLVVTTNHNQRPRKLGGGSAIFLHLIREGATGTEGCIALSEKHLRIVLAHCGPKTQLVI
jgi:L,D-peptidoglycan transpeptidase YkuD (ErfK/YbiS/YcfS/YnhG family)